MIVDYISDAHIDFWVKEKDPQKDKFHLQIAEFIDQMLPEDKTKVGDVLILAGDISHYNQQTKQALVEFKKYYKHIFVVFGNHDLYLVSGSQVNKYKAKSEDRLVELKQICEELGAYYLDGNIIEVEGIKFGGAGSWYDLDSNNKINRWKQVMNDANLIYDGYKVQPYGMYQSYSQPSTNWDTQKFWLKEKEKLKKIAKEGCDVFITHIGLNEPTVDDGMNMSYLGDLNNIFYYTSSIELLKESKCKFHIHGHTHDELDYTKEGIKILCNPVGYQSENFGGIPPKIKQFEI